MARAPDNDKYLGKLFTSKADAGEGTAPLAELTNANPSGRVQQCWIFDRDTLELVGGWANNFLGDVVYNRFLQRTRTLVATQLPVSRGPKRESPGTMVAAGPALTRATKQLTRYLPRAGASREEGGVRLEANRAAQRDLVLEFLDLVRGLDPELSRELQEFADANPEDPMPAWLMQNYQVRLDSFLVLGPSLSKTPT